MMKPTTPPPSPEIRKRNRRRPTVLATFAVAAVILSIFVFLFGPFSATTGPGGEHSAAEPRPREAASSPKMTARDSARELVRNAERQHAGSLPPDSPAVEDFFSVFHPEEITVHLLSDFLQGDLSNLVAADSLRLGDERGFPPRGAPPGQRHGVYVSPEQEAAEEFDILVTEAEAALPDGSELVFEFRTRPANGEWSVWQRIEPNEMSRPLGLTRPAASWQYRLTLFAEEHSEGPAVHSVAFATRPTVQVPAENPVFDSRIHADGQP